MNGSDVLVYKPSAELTVLSTVNHSSPSCVPACVIKNYNVSYAVTTSTHNVVQMVGA